MFRERLFTVYTKWQHEIQGNSLENTGLELAILRTKYNLWEKECLVSQNVPVSVSQAVVEKNNIKSQTLITTKVSHFVANC